MTTEIMKMITPCVWVSLSNSDVLRVLQQIATDAVNNGQQLQLTFPLVQGNRIDINVQGPTQRSQRR